MNTQQGSEIFSAIIAAPFGAMGIRTEDGRLRELVYLPPHYQEKSAQDAVAEQAAVQVARYFEDPDFRFDLPLFEAGSEFQRRVWEPFARSRAAASVPTARSPSSWSRPRARSARPAAPTGSRS
jgi:O6-methylguanine-DNA--protein-cysteine methyltransferase